MILKLYRGLKQAEFKEFDQETSKLLKEAWKIILELRANGEFDFPEDLSPVVRDIKKHEKLSRQYFTDRKETAEKYAKAEKGALVSIKVPISDVLKHFILELQNYKKRKEKFEITYCVLGETLFKNSEKWNLKVKKF